MKKIISLLLSVAVLFSITIGTGSIANAASIGFIPYAQKVNFDTSYTDYASQNSPNSGYASSNWRFNSYMFAVPSKGTITIYFESENPDYFKYRFSLYSSEDVENEILESKFESYSYNANDDVYYSTISIPLSAGTYFLNYEFVYTKSKNWWGSYDITLKYKASVSKPNSLMVSTRNTTSLKLSWSKVSGVSGYQLQRKSGDSYKTLVNTTSTSYTAKKLKAGTTYSFRVRAYKTIDGKKYYSAWKTLKTPTKPSRPSIKTPSTNKKHQIIAKWSKVTNCSGYQVQYSKKKSFSSVIATRTVSGSSKTSYTGKNFTKGKTYYVRVRSYKAVDGKKYYSSWSSVKSIKCK